MPPPRRRLMTQSCNKVLQFTLELAMLESLLFVISNLIEIGL